MKTTTRARRSERELLRDGRPAVERHWVPELWTSAFTNGDADFGDDDDERWNEAAATAFEERLVSRGYRFAGPTDDEREEFREFDGQRGRLVQVAFSDRAVFDADEAAGVFCITGCDDGPTEYVLRRGVDAVVRLPANFETRLLDPGKPADDPYTEATLPAHVWTAIGETGPARLEDGCNDAEEIDAAWTEARADAVALALRAEGWTIEQVLSATTRQGWFGGHVRRDDAVRRDQGRDHRSGVADGRVDGSCAR